MKPLTSSILSCVLVIFATFPALALSGPEIALFISGKKVILSTSYGKMPLRYNIDQTVLGDGSNTGLVSFFAPKETGKWWIAGGRLCQKWPTWYDGKAFCFKLEKTSATSIKWVRDDGYTGTAVISD